MVETLPRFPYDLYDNWELDPYNSLPVDITNARPAGQFGVSPLWNQGFMFDFKMEISFEASRSTDPDNENQCKGVIRIHDFTQDDDELNMDVSWEKETDFMIQVKNILGKEMTDKLLETKKSLQQTMKSKDAGEIKLKKDQIEREKAKQATKEAQAQEPKMI